ncbi:MAG: dTMP kinase [Candidatus Auribacterota bacterium]|jgi:dTMP kinase|nr:dTMP kinase [Candidatus Auribacterota bacterium]
MSGLFITFEGPEGCGKTTQARLLADLLASMGYNIVCTEDPGGTKIGDKIRNILLDPDNSAMASTTELLLFLASRHQLVHEVIKPQISAENIVICSRFFDATMAYQGYGRGLDMDFISGLNNAITGGITPDLTIYLDMEPTVSIERVKARISSSGTQDLKFMSDEIDRIEQELIDFHERVRNGYLDLAKKNPDRIKILNADDTVENVQADVKELVIDVLEKI